jgi:hypothetical protein
MVLNLLVLAVFVLRFVNLLFVVAVLFCNKGVQRTNKKKKIANTVPSLFTMTGKTIDLLATEC